MKTPRVSKELFDNISYELSSGAYEDFGDDRRNGVKGWEILNSLSEEQRLELVQDYVSNFFKTTTYQIKGVDGYLLCIGNKFGERLSKDGLFKGLYEVPIKR